MIKVSTKSVKIEADLTKEQETALLAMIAKLAIGNMEAGEEREAPAQPQATAPTAPKYAPDAWHGYILAECEECGNTFWFRERGEAQEVICKECGHTTKLEEQAKAKLTCPECGKVWKYKTNAMGLTVNIGCPACKAEMEGKWDKERQMYVSEEAEVIEAVATEEV